MGCTSNLVIGPLRDPKIVGGFYHCFFCASSGGFEMQMVM